MEAGGKIHESSRITSHLLINYCLQLVTALSGQKVFIRSVVTDCTKKQRKITMHHFSHNDCHGPGNGRVK